MLILLRGPQLLGVKIQTGQNELYLAIVSPHVNRQSKTVLDSRFRFRFPTDSGFNSKLLVVFWIPKPRLSRFHMQKPSWISDWTSKIFCDFKIWNTLNGANCVSSIDIKWALYIILHVHEFLIAPF